MVFVAELSVTYSYCYAKCLSSVVMLSIALLNVVRVDAVMPSVVAPPLFFLSP
jgi:hypothetical protein